MKTFTTENPIKQFQARIMGRSAKFVRTASFEKQKRAEKGKEWKTSQGKKLRQEWKKFRSSVRPVRLGVAHNLSGSPSELVQDVDLGDLQAVPASPPRSSLIGLSLVRPIL